MSLLSGRQLVAELGRLGLGTWTADAVRQWIRETPPCPVAEHADQGKPHRYRVIDVLTWLAERERRAKAKGFTTGGGAQLAERIDVVLRHFVAGTVPPSSAPAPDAATSPSAATPSIQNPPTDGADPARDLAAATDPHATPDWESLNDIEAVLAVLRGHAPQAWKATEEALNQRRRRLEAEGKLVPVDEVEAMLSTQALAMRSAAGANAVRIAQRIPDHSSFDQRLQIVTAAMDEMLNRLASDDDAASEPPEDSA